MSPQDAQQFVRDLEVVIKHTVAAAINRYKNGKDVDLADISEPERIDEFVQERLRAIENLLIRDPESSRNSNSFL